MAPRNYREPPEALQRTQQAQINAWCRYDPVVCLVEVCVEAVFIALSYTSMLFLTGGAVPPPTAIAKFLACFVVLSVAARMVSDDLGNKLSISAVSGIGSKAVSVLAPRFVGW